MFQSHKEGSRSCLYSAEESELQLLIQETVYEETEFFEFVKPFRRFWYFSKIPNLSFFDFYEKLVFMKTWTVGSE